ncbi:MAG: TlpA family protein disulfide reductase [Flavobacteriales bacterium]|nr:TlpA family protein disulfide reductase [Flavobacteriales bacterium]
MKSYLFLSITVLFLLSGCSSDSGQKEVQDDAAIELAQGRWLLHFKLTDNHIIPANFNLNKIGDRYAVEFTNGDEKIAVNDITIDHRTIKIFDPVFNTWFEGELINEKTIRGTWYKNDKSYTIPFEAYQTDDKRFVRELVPPSADFNGKWEVDFSKDSEEDHYKAIGQFEQKDNYLTGTFMTETGDYRFLEGNVYGDSAFLSCFDGAHLFLFEAQMKGDSMSGKFWSGTHWQEPWVAGRNENFELTNPDSLTFLKEGYDRLAFTFPDTHGDSVSLSDEKYKNKVVIVNIMAPWCPNCKDETAYLSKLYKNNHDKGLEIIALSFDNSSDFEVAKKNIEKIKAHFAADYDFLIAGESSKIVAAKALPMLNHIMSYPTSIFIDRKGNIRKIRTGFYGPGTGEYYLRYTEQTDNLVAKLLEEQP